MKGTHTSSAFSTADTSHSNHLRCLPHNLPTRVQLALYAGTDILCRRKQQYSWLYILFAQCAISSSLCCTHCIAFFPINICCS